MKYWELIDCVIVSFHFNSWFCSLSNSWFYFLLIVTCTKYTGGGISIWGASRIYVYIFFLICALGVLKLIMSVSSCHSLFFDIKKKINPKDFLAQIPAWGTISEKNLWLIFGVTDTKLDQLQYCWHWLRGVTWGMEKTYLIKLNTFFTNAPETRINNLFPIKQLTENWKARSWLAEVRRSSGHKGLWRPLKFYSCASLIQLKHHYSLRCWNHLVLWMHNFVLKIPFSYHPGKTEVESKLVNALKWFVFLTGNPPTVFPKHRFTES